MTFSPGFWLPKTCFVTIHAMQSFNTEPDDAATPVAASRKVIVGAINDLQPGECARFELPDGDELAIYNVDGEFYAIDNSCPHRGAPLSEGVLCGHVIECGLHFGAFHVPSGKAVQAPCFTDLKTFRTEVKEGQVYVDLSAPAAGAA